MTLPIRRIFTTALFALPALAYAAASAFPGADRPIPIPPNPHNNPWLNYPATYGANAPVRNHGNDVAPDAMANLDRFMKLNETGRAAHAKNAEAQSLKRGQELFSSTRLGTLGLNCQSCHTNGGTSGGKIGVGDHELPILSLMGVAKRYPRFNASTGRVITQTEMQNNCIAMFMKGERLPAASQDAADLTYFVSTFQ
jgi:cytochrome c